MVLPIATYSSETWTLKKADEQRWTLKKADEQRLRVFEMACLRKILGVTRRDRLRYTRVRELLHYCKDLPTSIRKTKLKYVGHVNRMGSGRYTQNTSRRPHCRKQTQRKTRETMAGRH